MYELKEIMRQKEDKVFAEALNRLSIGKLTQEDILLFKSREIQKNEPAPPDAIRLFSTNAGCAAYNKEYLDKLPSPPCDSWAIDSIIGKGTEIEKTQMLNFAKGFSTADADGMPSLVCLKVGSRYMDEY